MRRTFLLFVLLCLLWGSTFSVNKIGLEYAPPMFFTGLRVTLAGIALAILATATYGFSARLADLKHILVLSLGNVIFNAPMVTLGLTAAGAGESSIVLYTQPILVAVLAAMFLRERLNGAKLVGLGLGFAGVISVLAGKVSGFHLDAWWAYLSLLVAAGTWAGSTIYFRARPLKTPLLWIVAIQSLIGGPLILAVAWPIDHYRAAWSWTFGIDLAYGSVVGLGLGWLLWLKLLEKGEVSKLVCYLFMVPGFAALFGILTLGERLMPLTVVGLLLTMGGIYLVNRPAGSPDLVPALTVPAETYSEVIA